MDSNENKNNIIVEISTVVQSLSLKIEALHAKVSELCLSTKQCERIKKINNDLAVKKNESE